MRTYEFLQALSGADALLLTIEENDSGEDTLGGYLAALLETLFDEDEGFSGKRPFGNSGWTHDLNRIIIGMDFDEYDSCAMGLQIEAERVARRAIAELRKPTNVTAVASPAVVAADVDGGLTELIEERRLLRLLRQSVLESTSLHAHDVDVVSNMMSRAILDVNDAIRATGVDV